MSKYAIYCIILQSSLYSFAISHSSEAQVKKLREIELSLAFDKSTLKEVFQKIEEDTDFTFAYLLDDIPKGSITLSGRPRTMEEILLAVARQSGVSFRRVNGTIHVKDSDGDQDEVLVEFIQKDQGTEVTGTVTDENGESLPGATVLEQGTTNGTITDIDGKFKLIVNEGAVLLISFVGYQTEEVTLQGGTVINVSLTPDIGSLEEVVVVGYGTQKKVSMTSAVSTVSDDDLVRRTTKNLSSNLQGLAPGLTVLDRGGSPGGADFTIFIRGVTTLDDNNPLVIVDGMEMHINDVDPNNIQSVSVLKDAASTAIYGSRAANGVILITTKRGEAGRFKVNYSASFDLQNLTAVPEHMDTEAYLRLQNIAYVNNGSAAPYTEDDIRNYVSGEDRINYPLPNDFFNTVIQENALMQRHALSISGGTDKMTTNVMLNYFDQDGIYPNQNSQRYVVRMNNDIKLTDALKLSADLSIRRKDRFTFDNEDNVYHRMLHSSQFVVPRYPDGSYGLSPQRHNPLAWTDPDIVGGVDGTTDDNVINLKGSWDILEGLTFTSQYALELIKHSSITNIPTYEIVDERLGVSRSNDINRLKEYRYESIQRTWNNTLGYNLELDGHALNLLAGYSEISYDYKNLTAEGSDFYNNDLRDLNQGDPLNRTMETVYEDWGLRSFFGRAHYAFNDRYIVEFNMRYDGSSIFPEGNRYTFFPSVAAAWRLSEEAFWDPLRNVVDQFKLRGSWGEAGNNNIQLYSYFDNLALANYYVFNGQPVTGVRQNVFASQNLRWETTTQTNIGVDLSFLEGRINATVDWFSKVTDDILLTLPIPAVIGLGEVPTNAGSLQNKGWDMQLSYRNNKGDFRYAITLNLSDVKNEILDLAGTGPYYSGEKDVLIRQEGQPIDALFGYKTDGFYTQEDFENGYPTLAGNAQVGDIKYVDYNNDGELNAEDRTVIGSTIPRLTYGSSINLGWKDFDLNLQLQGVGNQDVALAGSLIEAGSWEGFTIDMAKDYWTPENTDARFPRPQKRQNKNTHPSDWWVVNGAFLRLKNLQLGYTLPAQITEKVGVSRFRVYVGGTNLLTFSDLNEWGLDAEAGTLPGRYSGRGNFYPATKTYTFGFSVGF